MTREAFLKHGASPSAGPSHIRSRKQEKELAKRTKGRITPGSGNKNIKGDVRVRRVARIEAKTTMHKSFSVTLDMIEKLENAALPSDEIPIIVIEFNDGRGKKLKEVAIMPTYVLDKLS